MAEDPEDPDAPGELEQVDEGVLMQTFPDQTETPLLEWIEKVMAAVPYASRKSARIEPRSYDDDGESGVQIFVFFDPEGDA